MSVPDKTYPQSLDTERAILGAMLVDTDCVGLVIEHISAQDFHSPQNSMIFAAIKSLYASSDTIDQITVMDALKREKQDDKIGGHPALSGLYSEVAGSSGVTHHCRILKDKYIKRRIITACKAIEAEAFEDKQDGDVLLSNLGNMLTSLDDETVKKDDYISVASRINSVVAQYQETNSRDNMLIGIDTGIPTLNHLIGGFQGGKMIVLAGKRGEGKSALGLEFAITSAAKGSPVGIFSLEMTSDEIIGRVIQNKTPFQTNKIYQQKLEDQDWRALTDGANEIHNMPIYISDRGGLSITELMARARRMHREHGVKMIVVDYLQLVAGMGQSREQEVSNVSRSLKALSLQLNIPIIAISQFSRGADRRDGPPKLSDLRESGAIEQDADIVLMIYNRHDGLKENVYHDYGERENDANIRELIVKKNRGGRNDKTILLYWEPDFLWLKELSLAGKYQTDAQMRRNNSKTNGE